MPEAQEVVPPVAPVAPESTPPPTPLKKNPLLPAVIILIVVLIVVGAILIFTPFTNPNGVSSKPTLVSQSQQQKTLNTELEKGKVLLAKQIAQVGKEILYGKDLSYYYYQIYKNQFTNSSEEQVRSTILPTLVEQSIILQAAQKLNLIQLTSDVFNNLDKNQTKRITLFNQAYAALQEQESIYSGEVIAIWYYNQKAPKLPLDQAEQLAKSKLEALQTQIASGTLTMQEAGEKIRQDTTLLQIDTNYKANAYMSFVDVPLDDAAGLNKTRATIATLKPGEVSSVIQIQDDVDQPSFQRQELFVIVKLNDKKTGKLDNFNEWLNKEKKQYAVKYY